MAGLARHCAMPADKWKPRFCVIKRCHLGPYQPDMAILALGSQPAHMGLILVVAVNTQMGCGPKFGCPHMALPAGNMNMRSRQLKISHRVIERIPIQADDIGLSPFVIGMAQLAAARADFTGFAVQAGFAGHVRRDILMAAKTFLRLGCAGKRLVAGLAIALKLRMRL